MTVEVEGDKVLDKLLAYPITVPQDTQLDWQLADQSQDQSGFLPPCRPSSPLCVHMCVVLASHDMTPSMQSKQLQPVESRHLASCHGL